VVPATGEYILTFFFAAVDNEPTRTAVITASGGSSITVVVATDNSCCMAQPVRVVLVKGENAITFANPQGHAPAIDRITISAS
jgi:hypothetical protein